MRNKDFLINKHNDRGGTASKKTHSEVIREGFQEEVTFVGGN